MAQPPRGDSREIAIGAKSDLSNTYVPLECNPTTKALKVDLADSLTPSADSGINGGPVTVGTTAVEMTFTGTTKSIFVQADHSNTGTIWVGPATVDNAGANAYSRLEAGEYINIDFNDTTTAIYSVSDTASQKVYKVALT